MHSKWSYSFSTFYPVIGGLKLLPCILWLISYHKHVTGAILTPLLVIHWKIGFWSDLQIGAVFDLATEAVLRTRCSDSTIMAAAITTAHSAFSPATQAQLKWQRAVKWMRGGRDAHLSEPRQGWPSRSRAHTPTRKRWLFLVYSSAREQCRI